MEFTVFKSDNCAQNTSNYHAMAKSTCAIGGAAPEAVNDRISIIYDVRCT